MLLADLGRFFVCLFVCFLFVGETLVEHYFCCCCSLVFVAGLGRFCLFLFVYQFLNMYNRQAALACTHRHCASDTGK